MNGIEEQLIKIKLLAGGENGMLDSVVSIHLATFRGFFLTFMGRGFLKQMYRSYCEHNESDLLVAVDSSGTVVGFLAYSEDMSGLYKYMIKRHIVVFAWYSLGAFLRRPKIFIRLIRAFLKPGEAKRNENYVELASIGVDPNVKSKGIGTAMIHALKERVDFSKHQYISLETDALNNKTANCFYVKNGFVLHRVFETREGRIMNEYRFQE